MLQNYKIVLQYEGTRYQGWQKQDSTDNTLQGKLELLLSKMCDAKVEIQGSGRTDSGVHAYGQVANFQIEVDMSPQEIMDYMNLYLPEDIGVISIEIVSNRFHSRLNAKGKIYQYRVLNTSIPHLFDRRYVYQLADDLDVEAMKIAAEYLCGTHDFKAFTSNRKNKKSTVRTIESITIETKEDEISFVFKGNGFLYHMVRILVGTLLEVGLLKRKPEDMIEIIKSENRENAGMLVPAKGLALMEVIY